MHRDLTRILVPFVYFIAGATSIAGVATTFYYKEDLHLTIEQVAILGSISIIPWSIKPLYGLLSDRLPIAGLRRKPYLFLSGIFGAAGYFSLATWVQSFTGALIAVLLSGLGLALADVIVDGLLAEKSRTQAIAGKLQSVCRASLMVGALLVAYLSGVLVETLGARNVFFITGTLPLLTTALSLFIFEEEMDESGIFSLRETWQKFKGALTPAILWSAFFLLLWRSTPTSGGAFNYFVIDEFGFSPEFFGRLTVISRLMSIIGVLFFRQFLISVPLKKLLFWIIIASVVLSLPSFGLIYGWYKVLGVSPQFFAVADELITAPLTEIGFLPLLVLVARICPRGVEATMFAVLASLMNIGLAVSDLGGAFLVHLFDVHQATEALPANYTNLDKVVWIAVLSSLLPMPFLRFLPETRASDELLTSDPSSILTDSLSSAPGSKQDIA
ncbi:MAG TPA: folate/biopterin family MFS transporter [Candidatus Peribacterales bacterium]|nr:folate/biopterin family MFS transporter [Candidatus Peribacterales bacterium]